MRFWKQDASSFLWQWGDLVHMTQEDVRTRGLDILLGEFYDFQDRSKSAPSEVTSSPKEKRRAGRLLSDCDQVSISLHSGPELWIQPVIITGRGSGRGDPKDKVVLPLPSDNLRLLEALDTAYSRCATVYDR